jgi:hypothetical protein
MPPDEASISAAPVENKAEHDEPAPTSLRDADVLIPDTQSTTDVTIATSSADAGQRSHSAIESGSNIPVPGLDDYADIRAQMDDPQFAEWVNSQSADIPHMPAQERQTDHELSETGKQTLKPEAASHETDAESPEPIVPELPIPPQSPEQHQPGKNRSRRKLPMWIQTRQSPPRAGRKLQRMRCMKRMGLSTDREGRNRFSEKIWMKSLKPCQRKNSVTTRCFTVSTGKMRFTISATVSKCNGASEDKRKVLAALAVASRYYGGVVELTGSTQFKEQAMRLIIEYDLDIRMKLPAQRAQLEAMRQQFGATRDSVTTHIPTPDLNRQTPSPDAASPVSPATAAPKLLPLTLRAYQCPPYHRRRQHRQLPQSSLPFHPQQSL